MRRTRRLVALAPLGRSGRPDPAPVLRAHGAARPVRPSRGGRPCATARSGSDARQRPVPASEAARRTRTRAARAPRTRSSRARARPSASSSAQVVRAWRARSSRHCSVRSTDTLIDCTACIYCNCIRCTCMYCLGDDFFLPALPAVGRASLGRAVPAVRRPLPRRARRLDGRRRAPVDPGRPRPHHLPAAVGRLGLRARLRRPAAARRPRRRPARPPPRADRGAVASSRSPRWSAGSSTTARC